jgi:DNA-binding HxlR family transcriptional regulator
VNFSTSPAQETATRLAALTHHRWAIPVMGELERGRGAKLVTLVMRLGIGRASVRRVLTALIDAGWVMRNPGHGHPMRPEYIFTHAGQAIGPACARLQDALVHPAHVRAAQKKWSLPILYCLHQGAERFSELLAALPDATPRALTSTLKALVDAGLVTRAIVDGYPPRPSYAVADDADAFMAALRALAGRLVDGDGGAGP